MSESTEKAKKYLFKSFGSCVAVLYVYFWHIMEHFICYIPRVNNIKEYEQTHICFEKIYY